MTGQWEGGKGDRRRKHANDTAYAEGWNRIFGNDRNNVNVKEKRTKQKDRG